MFIDFSCYGKNLFQGAVLEDKSADLCSKVWFLTDVRISGDQKIYPWASFLAEKPSKSRVARPGVSDLEPTWARPAAQNSPSTDFDWLGIDFGPIQLASWLCISGKPAEVSMRCGPAECARRVSI